jgi:hypothetical protein
MASDMKVQDYSERAIVVRGEDTKIYKEQLQDLGGKYNAMLRDGPGWIFPKAKEDKILKFVLSCDGEIPKVKTVKSLIKKIVSSEEKLNSIINKRVDDQIDSFVNYVMMSENKMEFMSKVFAKIALAEKELLEKSKVPTPITAQKQTIVSDNMDSDVEEEEVPRKRLLR